MAYFVKVAGKRYGPLDAEKVKRLAAAGKLSRDDSISKDGTNWVPAGNVKGLFPPAELIVPHETEPAPIPTVVRDERSDDLVVYAAQATRDATVAAAKTTGQLSAKGAGIVARGTVATAKATAKAISTAAKSVRLTESAEPRTNVSSFIGRSLMPNETVVCVTRVHPYTIYEPIATLCLMIVLAGAMGAVAFSVQPLVLIPVGLVFLVLVLRVVIRLVNAIVFFRTTECVLTEHRIIGKCGFIVRDTMELLLSKTEGITVHQGLWGRILGFGTVVVTGTGSSSHRFHGIEHPFEFRKRVQEQIVLSQKR